MGQRTGYERSRANLSAVGGCMDTTICDESARCLRPVRFRIKFATTEACGQGPCNQGIPSAVVEPPRVVVYLPFRWRCAHSKSVEAVTPRDPPCQSGELSISRPTSQASAPFTYLAAGTVVIERIAAARRRQCDSTAAFHTVSGGVTWPCGVHVPPLDADDCVLSKPSAGGPPAPGLVRAAPTAPFFRFGR